MYDRPDEYVMIMKDKQMLIFVKKKLQPAEDAFLKQKGDALQLWKKSVPKSALIAALVVIAAACVLYGVWGFLAA